MTKMEVKPLASLGHSGARKKSRVKKRTPTGSANRILAPAAPQRCPIDANGRYQSTFDDETVTDGWPLSAQISQAGNHIEFQLAPLLTVEQCQDIAGDKRRTKRDFNKFIIFGGGDFNGANGFSIYFYETGSKPYEYGHRRIPDSYGSIEQIGNDQWKMELRGTGGPTRQLRKINILGRYNGGPTPFMQSLPGLVRRIRHRRPTSTEALTASMLWWPLHPWQKRLLREQVPQIRSNIRQFLLTDDVDKLPDRLFNIEKRLILAREPWINLDLPAARLYLRNQLAATDMTIDGVTQPVLAFLDNAVRLYRARLGTAGAHEYKHPLRGQSPIHLLTAAPRSGYIPEIFYYVQGKFTQYRYKAKLEEFEVSADVGLIGIGSSASGLTIEKFKLDEAGGEEHLDTYYLVLSLIGASLGAGAPVAVTAGEDTSSFDTPYDWQGPDFTGVATLGEFGATYVDDGKGGTMSEETLIVFGNNDMIPYPLEFDFGDVGITIKGNDGAKQTELEIDEKYGFGIDVGATVMVGWIKSLSTQRDDIIITIKDAQMDTEIDSSGSVPGFDFGSALLNGRGLAMLDMLVARERYALMHPQTRLLVAAHADLPDTPDRNLELTDLRARNTVQAIKDRLLDDFGLNESRTFALGLGDSEQLKAEGFVDTNEENPQFRRADIEIDSRYVVALRAAGKASLHRG